MARYCYSALVKEEDKRNRIAKTNYKQFETSSWAVKQVWNVTMHVLHNYLVFNKHSTAYYLANKAFISFYWRTPYMIIFNWFNRGNSSKARKQLCLTLKMWLQQKSKCFTTTLSLHLDRPNSVCKLTKVKQILTHAGDRNVCPFYLRHKNICFCHEFDDYNKWPIDVIQIQ